LPPELFAVGGLKLRRDKRRLPSRDIFWPSAAKPAGDRSTFLMKSKPHPARRRMGTDQHCNRGDDDFPVSSAKCG